MCNHVDKKLCVCNETKSMWIKCSERMPELNELVLVKAIDCVSYDPYFCVAKRIKKNNFQCSCYDTIETKPTHWMPLPQDPKD